MEGLYDTVDERGADFVAKSMQLMEFLEMAEQCYPNNSQCQHVVGIVKTLFSNIMSAQESFFDELTAMADAEVGKSA